MKLTVLVPSEEYKSYAGARIRYVRLEPELRERGIHLHLSDIGSYDSGRDASDALLISKCHDARALVAAAAGRQRGALVGVDLFDDYFSQTSDSRLTRFRTWLSQLLSQCDFALCSTSAMAHVVNDYRNDVPVQVVNDPVPVVNSDDLPRLLASKLEARAQQTLRIAWFGVGDNPHFRVGLNDLSAFAGTLRAFSSSGVTVDLTVLTNARALTADGLSLAADLPVRTHIREWTEEAERELLEEAFACILPVNAQRFSAAKSLNRAVTALAAGCQVISLGYPLYAALNELIYRDVGQFLRDFANGTMKHSAARISTYREVIDKIASPSREATAIGEFLASLTPRTAPMTSGPLVLVQGQSPNGLAHKAIKALRGLSVASPFCPPALGFDVVFRGGPEELHMYVSNGAAVRLQPGYKGHLNCSASIADRKFWWVPLDDGPSAVEPPTMEEWQSAPLPFQLATYGHTITRIRERIEEAFGPCRILISENSQLPFSPEI